MRLALIAAVTTAAGLGACAVPPAGPSYGYGYQGVSAPAAVPYYDGGYAPGPYYERPGYAAPYLAPGPTIIVGGERRFDERERYRNDRRGPEQGFRDRPNQPPPGRQFGGQPEGQPGRPPGRPEARQAPPPTYAPPPQNRGPQPQPPSYRGHAPDFNPASPGLGGGDH